jgi:hypothetical protein
MTFTCIQEWVFKKKYTRSIFCEVSVVNFDLAWWNKGCSIYMCNIFPILFDGDYTKFSESAAYVPSDGGLCR